MIKVLLPLCVIFFIVLYMAFAFVNWDMAWAAHDMDVFHEMTHAIIRSQKKEQELFK